MSNGQAVRDSAIIPLAKRKKTIWSSRELFLAKRLKEVTDKHDAAAAELLEVCTSSSYANRVRVMVKQGRVAFKSGKPLVLHRLNDKKG